MSLVFLFHYLLLNMFRMLVHPSSGAHYILWIYFMCCIALVRCVMVLRCGSAGVVWYPYAGFSIHIHDKFCNMQGNSQYRKFERDVTLLCNLLAQSKVIAQIKILKHIQHFYPL